MRAVGALMYLATSTRPDIAYTVGVLARFSSNPGSAHVAALNHLFRYLQGTKDLKLVYSANVDEGEPLHEAMAWAEVLQIMHEMAIARAPGKFWASLQCFRSSHSFLYSWKITRHTVLHII